MSRRPDSDVVRASVAAAGPSPATQRADAQPGRRWAALVSGIVPRVLVALTFVLMALFVVVPILFTFYGATRDGSIGAPDTTFTLEWLRMVFTTRPLLTDLAATIGMSLAVAAVAVGLGTTFAWLLTRTDLGRTSILELVIMAPLFLSPLVGAIAWLILAAPESGLINVAARSLFGISGHVVDVASLGGVIFVMGLFFTPYGYLFVSAALKNMSGAFEEAAHMAGAGPLRTARKITVPMLRPAILSAFFLVAVLAAGMFGIPELLGRNSMSFVPQAVRVHRATLTLPANYGLAAALGLSILLISGIGLYLYRRAVRAAERFVTVTARDYRPRTIALRRLRVPALALCVVYGLFTIVLPYFALLLTAFTPYTITDLSKITLTTDTVTSVLSSPRTRDGVWTTALIGAIVPTLCLAAGVIVSYITVRTRWRIRRVVDYVATAPVAIPGIVFGTGLVWAYVSTPLYATVWILVFGFVAHYLPYAQRVMQAGFVQVDPTLEEAARVSGSSPGRAVAKVTLPLLRPSLLSGWILLFVLVVREVNVALMLVTPGTNVLSILTFDSAAFGDIQTATVLGLLQTVVLVAGVVIARYVFKANLRGGHV